MAIPGKRPFWMHQLVEYMMGAVFIAQGLQSHTPIVPSVLGGLVMLNTACAKGSMSAFRLFGRKTHRALDLVVIVVIIVMTIQPAVSVDNTTRTIQAVLAFVLAFIWWQSDFSPEVAKVRRERAGPATVAKAAVSAAAVFGGGKGSTGAKSSGAAAAPTTPRPAPAAPAKPANPSVADTVGRTAGRLAGKGINIYRARQPKK